MRPEITPRNIDFDLPADLPRHWHGGDPYVTAFYNGLSLMFPDGEKFFVDSVRRYQKRITDPVLQEQVRGFCAQEGMHGREHRHYNELLERQGFPVAAIDRFLQWGIRQDRKLPPRWQLAMTAALEHFTAIFADLALRDPGMFRDAHPAMARLWKWHALEEAEHKAVAFDVYRTIAPGFAGYLRRILVMLWVTIGFALQIVIHESWLLRSEGLFWKLRARRNAFRYFFVEPGILRRGLRYYVAFYRPGFHPWQIDSGDVVERWRTEYAVTST